MNTIKPTHPLLSLGCFFLSASFVAAATLVDLDFETSGQYANNFRKLFGNGVAMQTNGNVQVTGGSSNPTALAAVYDTTPASAAVKNTFTVTPDTPLTISFDAKFGSDNKSLGIYLINPATTSAAYLALLNVDINANGNDQIRFASNANPSTIGAGTLLNGTFENNADVGVEVGDVFHRVSVTYSIDGNGHPVLSLTAGNTTSTTVFNGISARSSVEIGLRLSPSQEATDLSFDNFMVTQAPRRTWVGSMSGEWDTISLNWSSPVLGITNYTDGADVVLDDTLDTGALNTDITLAAAFTPQSLTVSNTTYDYHLSGGSLSGSMELTKTGSGILTLGMANTFTGGSALRSGIVRLGNDGALGLGAVIFTGGGISSDSATARTLTNAVTISANATLGDSTDNGTLVLSGPVNLGGDAQQLTINSDVVLSGAVSNGGLTKEGDGTLSLNGINTYTGETLVNAGTLDGGGVIAGDLTIAVDATLSAGGGVSGTLTVEGTPTLAGTILAKLDRTNAQTSDKFVFNGGAVLAGNLTVVNIGNPLQSGDTFDLFDGALSGAFDTLNLPGGLAHWLTGDINAGGVITFTNNPPVASDRTMGVALGETASLLMIGGKNAPTDADGDSLSVTEVGAATSGTANFTSTEVIYTANGFLGTNTFTYTVADAHGATDTRIVTVIVYSPTGFNQLSATADGGNAYVTYLGIPGSDYVLEITHDLTPPIVWTPLITNTAAANGYLQFTNPVSLPPTNDYYRTQYVP